GIHSIGSSASSTVEDLIQQSCRLLASMTQCPSVAAPPSGKAARLHRIFLSPASQRQALLVMLLSTGHVEHRVVEIGTSTDEHSLEHISNFLNRTLAGSSLAELSTRKLGMLPTELAAHESGVDTVFKALKHASRSLTEERVILEGTSQLLRQPEYQDIA